MTGWSLVYDGFDPAREGVREALCALGNGYFATRGAAAETAADGVHYPGTYMAGCYNRLETAVDGQVVENEDLVNLPNWLPLTFRIAEGPWFALAEVELLSYRQELDLSLGVLFRRLQFRDAEGRVTSVSARRLVHMSEPHLAAQEMTVLPENWSGRLEFRAALDGRVVNAGVPRYRDLNNRHLEPLETGSFAEGLIHLKVRTGQSQVQIAQAARTRVYAAGEPVAVGRRTIEEPGYIAHEFAVEATEGRPVTVEKVVALYSSRDRAIAECGLAAREAVAAAGGFDDLLRSHARAWEHLWHHFDVLAEPAESGADGRAACVLRLHVFHLLQTVSLNSTDLDVGVPARGLHGEAYRGHVFWDELFIFPFLNLRMPEITRALLMYRYRRLGAARAAARAAGLRGAMYPWQSGSTGREESQAFHLNPKSGRWIADNSGLQRHVNAAIAYNVWQYYQVTGDLEFLIFFGAEMMLEIARFWASLATYNEALGRYEIRGVMGPDEYHDAYPDAAEPGLNNNAYTNLMAVWAVSRALKVLDLLPADRRRELCDVLDLHAAELQQWDEVSRKMRLVFHDGDILSQFEGYDELREFDWARYRAKYPDIQRLDRILEAEGDTPNRYKLSKQADVLMLFYLFSSEVLSELFERLGYPFEHETIPRNVDYYRRRTSHGSTLSRVVQSWVLARSDRPGSWALFTEALESDISDIQGGTTAEGIHLGAMAGTVDVIQRCYPGIETRGDTLWLNPSLPDAVRCLRLRVRYRGHSMELEMTDTRVKVNMVRCSAQSVGIGVKDRIYKMRAGEIREFAL